MTHTYGNFDWKHDDHTSVLMISFIRHHLGALGFADMGLAYRLMNGGVCVEQCGTHFVSESQRKAIALWASCAVISGGWSETGGSWTTAAALHCRGDEPVSWQQRTHYAVGVRSLPQAGWTSSWPPVEKVSSSWCLIISRCSLGIRSSSYVHIQTCTDLFFLLLINQLCCQNT